MQKNTCYYLFLFLTLAAPALGQIDDDGTKSPESPQEKKVFAALELAKMAAEANQPEISFEAVKRIAITGPVISKVDLGGLLSSPQQNNSMSFSTNSNQATPQQKTASRVAAKMIAVSDLWTKNGFDASQAFQVWFEHVFPSDSPNVINIHSQTLSNSDGNFYNSFSLTANAIKAPRKTGAQCLIEWASKTEKVNAVEQELAKRLVQPGNAEFGWLFKVWIAEANKATSEVYEQILAEIEPKMATQIVGLYSDLKTHAISQALKKLPANSELKSRFKKAFLKALPTTSNWNGNAENMNLLREWIVEAINVNDGDSAESIAEAVTSQWSSVRNGNESWVSSMESQAFMLLSRAAFEKKAFKLGSEWMQRVSFGANETEQGTSWFQLRGTTSKHFLYCPQEVRYDILSKQVWTTPMLGLAEKSSLMPKFLTPVLFRNEAMPPLLQLANANAASISALEWMMRDAIALGKQTDIEQKIVALGESKSDDLPLVKLIWSKARDQQFDLKSMIEVPTADEEKKPQELIKRLVPADIAPLPIEVEIAELALRDPSTKPLGIELASRLLESCLKHNKTAMISQCRALLHSATASSEKPRANQQQLKHFNEASDWDGGAILDGIPSKPVWISRNEASTSWGHEASVMQSYLFLKYPLTGDFEIAFRALDGSYSEPGIALGGILTEFLPYNKTIALNSIGYRHIGSVSKEFEKYKQGDWNQYRVKRNASEFQVYVNDEPAVTIPCEESAMPFVALGARSYRRTTIDDLKISGKTQIPRNVPLCTPRLAGWSSYYTQQLLEPLQLMSTTTEKVKDGIAMFDMEGNEQPGYDFERIKDLPYPYYYEQEIGDATYPWVVKDGVLESADQKLARQEKLDEMESEGTVVQPYVREMIEKEPTNPRSVGMIYYQRPLCDGETIDLEFYQDSKPDPIEGKARTLPYSISPTIGRTAMLLDQPDVALRWIAGDGEKEWLGTDPEQRVIDPEARQLSKAQLRERDWNTLSIRWMNGVATLTVNGQAVYERKWDSATAPQFGFYHNPSASQVRVRNITLSGNWPKTLPENLFELTQ
jgi:Protein of unknown function (DUF1583)/Protein of unknown function (DUF1581)